MTMMYRGYHIVQRTDGRWNVYRPLIADRRQEKYVSTELTENDARLCVDELIEETYVRITH